MGYAEKLGTGAAAWRARYKTADGTYATVKDEHGRGRRFRTRREAVQAADDEEARVRGGAWKDPAAGQVTFGEWVNTWYAGLDLAASTMQNYRHHCEEHLLPEFEGRPVAAILSAHVDAWEKKEKNAGYKQGSIRTWRATLHAILAAAIPELIPVNPAERRRGTGKRAGRSRRRGPEQVITGPLGALLIAERAAVLCGRDDEFVMLTLMHWTGMRLAEAIGLEREFFRLSSVRVEWQLYELDDGSLLRCPPKDDSYRDIDLPPFLSELVSAHLTRTAPQKCECHGRAYVFRGRRRPGRGAGEAAHHRRSGLETWVVTPAAGGWYPKRSAAAPRPVPLLPAPWPGVPVRGRNAQARAEVNWLPVARGLTPKGLRHSHKSLMAELRTPEVLSHERLGHEMGGIAGVYSHVTPAMRAELAEHLTARWLDALDARIKMCPRSPVPALDELLRARARNTAKGGNPKIISRNSPETGISVLRARPKRASDLGRGGRI